LNITFSIIIVTWNGLHHLKKFLSSVAGSDYNNFEIIIADNASEDGTVEWTKKHFPKCKTVTFDKNYGYAGGNNRAVKYANGDVLIFLNNDVEVDKYWLQHLSDSFNNNKADIVQPKIRDFRDKNFLNMQEPVADLSTGWVIRFAGAGFLIRLKRMNHNMMNQRKFSGHRVRHWP